MGDLTLCARAGGPDLCDIMAILKLSLLTCRLEIYSRVGVGSGGLSGARTFSEAISSNETARCSTQSRYSEHVVLGHKKSCNKPAGDVVLIWTAGETAGLRPEGTTRCTCSVGEMWSRSQGGNVYIT